MVDMLALPVWKWCALVESWAWMVLARAEDDAKMSEFEAFLDAPVNFTWMNRRSQGSQRDLRRPATWQTNKPGEALLSGRKKREG